MKSSHLLGPGCSRVSLWVHGLSDFWVSCHLKSGPKCRGQAIVLWLLNRNYSIPWHFMWGALGDGVSQSRVQTPQGGKTCYPVFCHWQTPEIRQVCSSSWFWRILSVVPLLWAPRSTEHRHTACWGPRLVRTAKKQWQRRGEGPSLLFPTDPNPLTVCALSVVTHLGMKPATHMLWATLVPTTPQSEALYWAVTRSDIFSLNWGEL